MTEELFRVVEIRDYNSRPSETSIPSSPDQYARQKLIKLSAGLSLEFKILTFITVVSFFSLLQVVCGTENGIGEDLVLILQI